MDLTPVINKGLINTNYQLDVLRLDLIHPGISGNKWFKLKYNIEEARNSNQQTLLTFGGAYSNHLAATAIACKENNLKSIGIVRGEARMEINPTLKAAKENGMQLYFVNRASYSKKEEVEFIMQLRDRFGSFYLVPEGGNNFNGILGCKEILDPNWDYDYIVCACGTGATFTGLYLSLKPRQIVIGINVLKGENRLVNSVNKQLAEISNLQKDFITGNEELDLPVISNSCISNAYSFSGYAKFDSLLIDFKTNFESRYPIPLDYVYTNKLLFATFDLFEKEKFEKGSKILAVHSGGLQGNKGFENVYQFKLNR